VHFIVSLIFILTILNANHVSWYGSFDKAHKEAIKQDKVLMVLLVKKDCNVCSDSIKTTFVNQAYVDKINKKFISVIVTREQKESYPIEMLYTFTYPTLFFLDNRELFVKDPIRGEITPDKLKIYLEQLE
jgi:thioredoxin-related protein